jgi:tetratricopeptide (TPR) repeat protein
MLEESVRLCQEIGDRNGLVTKLINLGNLVRDQGDYGAARGFYEASLEIGREVGDRRGVASGFNNLGTVAQRQGDYDTANVLYQQSLALYREVGARNGMASVIYHLSTVAQYRKDYSAAWALLEESLQICREIGDRYNQGYVLNDLGLLALNRGDYAVAWSFLEESVQVWHEFKKSQGMVVSLERMAALCVVEGKAETAARLWGEAEARREALGLSLPIEERDARDGQVNQTRAALGEEAFEVAWKEGRATFDPSNRTDAESAMINPLPWTIGTL